MTTIGKALNELEPGDFLNITKIMPAGSLEARRLVSGVMFYWRVTLNGKTHREPLGAYDPSAPPKSHTATSKGLSVVAATRLAEGMATIHFDNLDNGGYKAVKEAKQKVLDDKAATELRTREFTLSKLLDEYCSFQEKQGRSSFKDARSIFELHIKQAFPDVASQSANTVTMEQFVAMMRRLQKMGHGRTSNKLRSYARAAYQLALRASANAKTPEVFTNFGISHNPLTETVVDASSNRADKNPLKLQQMRLYWNSIKDLKGLPGSVLRLHMLTGAQRIEQFVKLKTDEIDERLILLWDDKGKPGKARENPVPLIPPAEVALSQCGPVGQFALSTDGGKTHIHATTLSKWAQAAVGGLIPDFQAKQLRSGVETLLASLKVDKEIRGRLQSHGIAGVQDAHYNGYEYIDEKQEALNLLYQRLIEKSEPLADSRAGADRT